VLADSDKLVPKHFDVFDHDGGCDDGTVVSSASQTNKKKTDILHRDDGAQGNNLTKQGEDKTGRAWPVNTTISNTSSQSFRKRV